MSDATGHPEPGVGAAPAPAPPDEGAPTPAPPAEGVPETFKRAHVRRPMHVPVLLTEWDGAGALSVAWEARTLDISRGGVGLVSRRMVHVGRGLLIEISGRHQETSRLLYGVVRNVRYEPGIGNVLGVQFEPIPEAEAIAEWLRNRDA